MYTPAVANDEHHWFLCHNGVPCSPHRGPRQVQKRRQTPKIAKYPSAATKLAQPAG
jgi:hypothetical protein